MGLEFGKNPGSQPGLFLYPKSGFTKEQWTCAWFWSEYWSEDQDIKSKENFIAVAEEAPIQQLPGDSASIPSTKDTSFQGGRETMS